MSNLSTLPAMPSFAELHLHTERLHLRPVQAGDEAKLFAIFSDPEVMRYWSTGPWTSIDRAVRLIADDQRTMAAGEHIRLALLRRSDELLIGTCSLFKLDAQSRRGEIGYALAKQAWGQGYVQEALGALIRHAFEVLGLRRLEAEIDPRNAGSAKSLARLGFEKEGFLRERWIVEGEVSDSAVYGLLAREWAARGGPSTGPG